MNADIQTTRANQHYVRGDENARPRDWKLKNYEKLIAGTSCFLDPKTLSKRIKYIFWGLFIPWEISLGAFSLSSIPQSLVVRSDPTTRD